MLDGFGIGPNDEVYAHTYGTLCAIKPDGTFNWTYPNITYWTAPAVSANGTIYIGTTTGVVALSPTGSLIWSYTGLG